MYTFEEGRGPVIHDLCGQGRTLDLYINADDEVQWLKGGGIEIRPHGYRLPKCVKKGKKLVEVSEQVDEGQISYKISTPGGTYFYHKEGAGFSSFIDIEGNDWIGYNDFYPDARGKHRGIPNMGWKRFGHPGYEKKQGAESRIVYHGDDRVTIHSVSADEKYEVLWDIYPTYATQTILRVDESYGFWWQYEGTPGGSCELDKDYYVLCDGTRRTVRELYSGDLPDKEWIYFVDPQLQRCLFLVHHQSDKNVFTATAYPNPNKARPQMAVAGWARSEPCCDTSVFYKTAGHQWSFGFIESTDYETVKGKIEHLLQQ